MRVVGLWVGFGVMVKVMGWGFPGEAGIRDHDHEMLMYYQIRVELRVRIRVMVRVLPLGPSSSSSEELKLVSSSEESLPPEESPRIASFATPPASILERKQQ